MTDKNTAMLESVVRALGDLKDDVVFVGGAIAGLLMTTPGVDPVRETYDVDCIVELGSSYLRYAEIEKELGNRGWRQGAQTHPADPICRFRKEKLAVDVMPTDPNVLGFAARWAREAIQHPMVTELQNTQIRISSAPYFLGMKMDAFLQRGNNDFYGSHDLEDFVAVTEGRPEIVDEVKDVRSEALRQYLAQEVRARWARIVAEALPATLRGDPSRCAVVEQRLRTMIQGV